MKTGEPSPPLLHLLIVGSRARGDDIEALGGGGQPVFSSFYERLRDIKDYHRRFPNIPMVDPTAVASTITGSADVPFAAEEGYGRYLDLHVFHDKYNNLPWNQTAPVDYFGYLRRAYHFSEPVLLGKGEEYVSYLQQLYEYTIDLLQRAHPLSDPEKTMEGVQEEFRQLWGQGHFSGETKAIVVDEKVQGPTAR
jgi:splicing factor 3A subunit 3